MNQLANFFEHATPELYAQLRKRRGLLHHKAALIKQQREIAKRLRTNEKRGESQLRIAASRLRASEIELKRRTKEESSCWTAYQTIAAQTDSLAKCFGIALAQVVNNKPGIADHVARIKRLASDWQQSFNDLRKAEADIETVRSTYVKLANSMESDRFAIRNLEAQINRTTDKLNNAEDEVNGLIQRTAKHMSFSAVSRQQVQNPTVDLAFFHDVRSLRRLLHRIECLQQLANNKPSEHNTVSLHDSVKQAANHAIQEIEHPLTFKISLRGKGRVQSVATPFTQESNKSSSPVNTRVVVSDTKRFSSSLPVKQCDPVSLGLDLTSTTLLVLNRATLDATRREVDNRILRLSSEAKLLTSRVADVLFTNTST